MVRNGRGEVLTLSPQTQVGSSDTPQTLGISCKETTARTSMVPEEQFVFYQAEDGSAMFLHPVNVQCLLAEYGSLHHAPNRLEGVILELESSVVTSKARVRQRYLRHVPVDREYVRLHPCNLGLTDVLLPAAVSTAWCIFWSR